MITGFAIFSPQCLKAEKFTTSIDYRSLARPAIKSPTEVLRGKRGSNRSIAHWSKIVLFLA